MLTKLLYLLTIWLNYMDKLSADTTEQVILEAARQVFIKDGLAGARMQTIADEAGINKAMLHYYFRNKNKLFETVFREAAHHFLPRINEIFESEAPLFEKIKTFCSEYISRLSENPYIPLFIINEINRQPDEFIQKMWGNKRPDIAKFQKQIESELKKGNIKNIHPMQLIMNMVSLCIFPFLAKPMIQRLAGVNEKLFKELIEQRKTDVSRFIIDSIKK
jgi:TetR/AcrR family transcriptional regulator